MFIIHRVGLHLADIVFLMLASGNKTGMLQDLNDFYLKPLRLR